MKTTNNYFYGSERFEDIIRGSKDFDAAYNKIKTIKDVPPDVADAFYKKYNPNENLSMEKSFRNFYDDVKSGNKKMFAGGKFPGGLLVGETDKNGEKGIEIVAPEGKIRTGGGEIVINEKSSKEFCQELSKINSHNGNGVVIPCGIQEVANTTDSKMEVGDVIKRAENGMKVSSEITPVSVINAGWKKMKEKLGERKAKKYFDQADRLINPVQNLIVEYRTNGIVTKEDGKYIFHPLIGMDYKNWWLGEGADISEQFNATAESGTRISESTEDKIKRLTSDYNNVFSREGDSQYARLLKKKISFLKSQLNKTTMKSGGKAGEYQVKYVGKRYFVIYKFSDGEEMVMSDPYVTEAGAEKAKERIMDQAGVSKQGSMAMGGKIKVGDFLKKKGSNIELEVKEVGNDWRSGKDYITIYNDVTNSTITLVDWSDYEKANKSSGGSMATGGEIAEGDFIKKSTGSGGVKYNTEGFVYEKSGDRVKLKDAYGNKSEQWYDLSGFRKTNPPMMDGGSIEQNLSHNAKSFLELMKKSSPNPITIDTTQPSKDRNKAIAELEKRGLVLRVSYVGGFADYVLNPKSMASGGSVSDLEKAKLKYAKQDINLLEKEHNIAITDTEHGVLWGSHKDGVFEFSTANGTNLFKGNKNQAIEFVKNSYTVEGMAGGGMIYIYKQKEYTPGELMDLASTTSSNRINTTRDAIHTLGIENVAIKGLGRNKEYWVGSFEQGGTTVDSGDDYYIARDRAKGFNVYESYYKKKGDKDWTKYILLSNPDLTEKQAISSAQSNFIYNSGVKLNYPREVMELSIGKLKN